MAARNVYGSESFNFVRKIIAEFCEYDISEKAFEIHKQDKSYDYTDELRLYGTKEKGIKYHSHIKVFEKPTSSAISTISNESFGFPNFWIKFTVSTQDGLILELEAEDQKLLEQVLNQFEKQFGYCRKQSKEEVFDELVHELRTRGAEREGRYGIELGLKAVEINPEDFWARFYLGCYFALNKQYKKSIEHLSIAVEKEPENYDALYNLALAYYPLNELEKAKELLLKAFSLSKNNHTIIYYLGKVSEKMNEVSEAIKYYQLAIETSPEKKPSSKKPVKSFLKEAEKGLKRLKK